MAIEANSKAGQRVPCQRCAKPCQVADSRNTTAKMAVEANGPGLCAECIVTAMVKGLIVEHGLTDVKAEHVCLPHVRDIIRSAVAASGSRLPFERLDFDEIAANWDLPIPAKQQHGLFW